MRNGRSSSAGLAATASIAVLGAAFVLLVVLIVSDLSDPGHWVWRDPISYFGSSQAPYPWVFNPALALAGTAILAWSTACWWAGRRGLAMATATAGAALVLLAVWPIDCSPVDDLCEVLIRGRFVSNAHDAHSYVGLVFFVALSAITIVAGRQTRRSSPVRWRRRVALATMALSVVAVLVIVGRPFAGGSGTVELLAVVVAGVAVWLSTASTQGSRNPT